MYTLYGSKASFYTGKIKPYLDYKPLEYRNKNASLWVYKTIIKPKTGLSVIPVVKTPDGEYLQDSTHIIDTIESNIPERSVYPETPKQKLAVILLELFSDEWLLFPAMHYRWSFPEKNYAHVTRAFGETSIPWAPGFLQSWVGRQVGKRFSGFLPILGINEKTKDAIETQFIDIIQCLNKHFESYQFFLGGKPSLADFAFIGPFHAHLYHDPLPKQILEEHAPNLVDWINRMWSLDEYGDFGKWLSNDTVPESLNPIFNILFKDAWPFFEDASNRLSEWIEANPEKKISRSTGKINFKINGVESKRLSPTYNQWMLQRPIKFFQSLSEVEQHEVIGWLKLFQGDTCIKFNPKIWVSRKNNRICKA